MSDTRDASGTNDTSGTNGTSGTSDTSGASGSGTNGARDGERPYDLVLYGATGFTGRLVAQKLAAATKPGGLRWALAGRDERKLSSLRAELDRPDLGLLAVDAMGPDVATLAKSAHVVASTVGPYMKYGHALVAACAEHGTDYCDLTGEPQFMRACIDACHGVAKKTGARLVHAVGFDSIPSDLGVLCLADLSRRTRGKGLSRARLYIERARGGASGGTVASMLHVADELAREPSLRRLLGDPYSLSPDRAHDLDLDGRDATGPSYDGAWGGFVAPFFMGPVNTRVVRRSNALAGFAYGRGFRYDEVMAFPASPAGLARAVGTAAATLGGVLALAIPKTRALVAGRLPKPGEGPTREQRERGTLRARVLGWVEGDPDARPSLQCLIEGKGDPGYELTSVMMAQAALALAEDERLPGLEGGVLTPATALGLPLVERLRRAGLSFEVRERVAR